MIYREKKLSPIFKFDKLLESVAGIAKLSVMDVTKCDRCCKVRHVLQRATGISKCKDNCKVRQVLQSVISAIKCYRWYKVRHVTDTDTERPRSVALTHSKGVKL